MKVWTPTTWGSIVTNHVWLDVDDNPYTGQLHFIDPDGPDGLVIYCPTCDACNELVCCTGNGLRRCPRNTEKKTEPTKGWSEVCQCGCAEFHYRMWDDRQKFLEEIQLMREAASQGSD